MTFGISAREWQMHQLDVELAEVMRRIKTIEIEPLSTAAEKCARWRRKSVPVGLNKKGLEALLIDARCEPHGA